MPLPAILIMQDASALRPGLPTLLRAAGLPFDTVADGAAALAAVRQRPYAMVMMNCGAPGDAELEAGWEIREAQLQHEGAPPLRMVAVVEDGAARDRERCIAAGLNECLIGPLTPEALPRLLGEWTIPRLSVFSGDAEPSETPKETEESPIRRAIGQLVAELDAASAVDMLDVLFAELPLQLQALRDRIGDADRKTFGRMAHSIAGSSGTFGLHEVRLLALEIENEAPAAEQAVLQQKIEQLSDLIDASMPELLRLHEALRE